MELDSCAELGPFSLGAWLGLELEALLGGCASLGDRDNPYLRLVSLVHERTTDEATQTACYHGHSSDGGQCYCDQREHTGDCKVKPQCFACQYTYTYKLDAKSLK